MTQSSVVKTVGGVTTKINTTTRTTTSSSQQILHQQQQQQQQQLQTKQKVISAKPPYMTNARNEKHISASSFQKSHNYEEPPPIIKQQQSRPEDICVRCNRIVYKMVAVIAENQVWHRSCFRCNECDMQLKFHAKVMDVGELKTNEKNDLDDGDSIYSEDYGDETDVDLLRAKRVLGKLPFTLDNVNEMKDKFEAGMDHGREARRMERKQEVQDIRSRVYLGKNARTKEKYENAVADLETNPKLRNKGLLMAYELDNVKAAAEKTRNAKQKFETGNIYRRNSSFDREGSTTSQISNKVSERMQMLAKRQAQDEIIKSNAKVKIMDKPDISNQCKFFENCNPEKQKGYAIKIDGINIGGLKMGGAVEKAKNAYIGRIKKSKTKSQQHQQESESTEDLISTQQHQSSSQITSGKSVNNPAQNSVRIQLKQANVNRF